MNPKDFMYQGSKLRENPQPSQTLTKRKEPSQTIVEERVQPPRQPSVEHPKPFSGARQQGSNSNFGFFTDPKELKHFSVPFILLAPELTDAILSIYTAVRFKGDSRLANLTPPNFIRYWYNPNKEAWGVWIGTVTNLDPFPKKGDGINYWAKRGDGKSPSFMQPSSTSTKGFDMAFLPTPIYNQLRNILLEHESVSNDIYPRDEGGVGNGGVKPPQSEAMV